MKLNVPTYYRVDFVRPKRRSEEAVCMRTEVDVEIREVDPVDAPVIHIIGEAPVYLRDHNGINRPVYRPFAQVDGKAVEVRLIDGWHYIKRLEASSLAEAAASREFDNPFNGFYRKNTTAGLDHEHSYAANNYRSREAFESEHGVMRKWIDRYDETAAALNERASEMAIVDGWLYERVAEPVLTVSVDSGHITLGLTEAWDEGENKAFCKARTPYLSAYHTRFGLDQVDRAVAYGERMAAAAGIPFLNQVDIVSVAPWEVRFRGEPEMLYERATAFINSSSGFLGSFDPMFGAAWHDLATATTEHDRITPAAVDAVTRLCAMSEDGPTWEHNGYHGGLMGHSGRSPENAAETLTKLVDGLWLWNSRENSGIEWVGLGAGATYEGDCRAWEVTTLMDADAITRRFGNDLSHMAAEAAADKGWLVAVEDRGIVRAACFVRDDGNGPEVVETRTAHGAEPLRRHVELALRHVDEALRNNPEDELAAFGF